MPEIPGSRRHSNLGQAKTISDEDMATTKVGPRRTHGDLFRVDEAFDGPSGGKLDIELRSAEPTDHGTLYNTYRLSPKLKVKSVKGAGSTLNGQMVPTFETTNISRVYETSATCKVKVGKKLLSASFSARELVILPAQLSPNVRSRPPTLDPITAELGAPLDPATAELEAPIQSSETNNRREGESAAIELAQPGWLNELLQS